MGRERGVDTRRRIEMRGSNLWSLCISRLLPVWLFSWVCACCLIPEIGGAQVLLADFNDLAQGFVGKSFTDGGITFSNLEMRGYPSHVFAIQTASGDLQGFSAPNFLVFGGYSPQPGFLVSRFGSCDISFSGLATAASINVLVRYIYPNLLTLHAISNGEIVDSAMLMVSEAPPYFTTLTVAGDFDRLRLVASGDYDSGAVLLGIDNTTVTIVAEAGAPSLLVMALGLVYAARRSRSQLNRSEEHTSELQSP